MANIKDISSKTIINLQNKNIEATPDAYSREFCSISNDKGLKIEQCELFTNALIELSEDEIQQNDGKEISTVYDLVKILLKRPQTHLLVEQTNNVADIIKVMDKHLDDAISSSKNGCDTIISIRDDIESVNSKNSVEKLKNKLIIAASTIENEISNVNEKLIDGKSEISILETRIQELENDLDIYKKESTIDHLTGLLTRRAYDKEVDKFEDVYIREQQDYAVVFFDLDDFKKVNDTYGHECGDSVLKTFGKILNKLTRKTDIVARYGGEEFISVLKYKNEEELLHYLKRVKDIVTNNKFTHQDLKLNITFSAGVDIRSSHKSYEHTIQQADILLYEAKDNGKNQLVLGSGTIV